MEDATLPGPNSDFDAAVGTIAFELDLLLSAESGRAKHTDVEEQGSYLLPIVERGLQAFELGPGAAFGSLRYMGAGEVGRPALQERQVGPYLAPFPEDLVRHRIWCLQGIVRRFAEVLDDVLGASPDAGGSIEQVRNPRLTEVLAVVDWARERAPLEGVDDPEWRDALGEAMP